MLQALDHEHYRGTASKVGPYLLLILVVPGGSIIACALWLVRLWRARPGR